MIDNSLLFYLSSLGSGNWLKFRRAVDNLGSGDDYRTVKARQLSHLGHVEFDFEGDLQWAVCPPTLAWLPSRLDSIVGVLCGQRTKGFLTQLEKVAQEHDSEIESCSQSEGPDAVFVRVPASHIGHRIAQKMNIHSEPDIAARLAHCLPPLQDYWHLCPDEPESVGYKMEIFDPDRLNWKEAKDSSDPGFYRYDYFYPEYRLKWNGRCIRTPKNVGIFLLLAQHHKIVLHYDDKKQTLTVPSNPKLPILFARAATLCSGLLPQYDAQQKQHVYSQVTPPVARYILTKLQQDN